MQPSTHREKILYLLDAFFACCIRFIGWKLYKKSVFQNSKLVEIVLVGFHCIIGYWLIHVTNRWFLLNLVRGFNNRDQAYFLKYVYGNENCLWYDKLSHKNVPGSKFSRGFAIRKVSGILLEIECIECYAFELCMNFSFNCLTEHMKKGKMSAH